MKYDKNIGKKERKKGQERKNCEVKRNKTEKYKIETEKKEEL